MRAASQPPTKRQTEVLAVLGRGGFWTPRQILDVIGQEVELSTIGTSLGGLYARHEVEREELPAGSGRYRWRLAE